MTLADDDGMLYEVLGIEDLVRAKKTQRDKDWPMIRRLVDAHYRRSRDKPNEDQIRFWLRESRTPDMLIEVASAHPQIRDALISDRSLLSHTAPADCDTLQHLLSQEEAEERRRDEAYWEPLIRELESLRRTKRERGNLETDSSR